MENFKALLPDIARWVLDLIWNGVTALGGIIAIAMAIYPYATGTRPNLEAIGSVLLATFILSAFVVWRDSRGEVRHLRAVFDAMQAPDFSNSLIEYIWVGEFGSGVGVFFQIRLTNIGATAKIADWHVTLGTRTDGIVGTIGNLPTEVYSQGVRYRILHNASMLSGEISRRHHLRCMLWSTFNDLSPADVDFARLRVHFQDDQSKLYDIPVPAWISDKAKSEIGTKCPYQHDDYARRVMRAAKDGPFRDWRRT